MSSTDGLVAKARFMRNAAPQQYADFFGAFADYARARADIFGQGRRKSAVVSRTCTAV